MLNKLRLAKALKLGIEDLNTNGPAVSCHALPGADLPVLVSIPHAGRRCPQWIADSARVSLAQLDRLADGWCDLIAAPLLARGAKVVKANVLRAVADCNRHESDMDPADVHPSLRPRFGPPGRKARAGLGVIPSRLPGVGPLWSHPIDEHSFEARLDLVHRPYHRLLEREVEALLHRHGLVLLVDLHSMPALPLTRGDPSPAKIVVGDRFGRSADPALERCFATTGLNGSYRTAHNAPYAGGHIIETHGNPLRNINAIQIEFDRRLYLDVDNKPDATKAMQWGQWLADCAEMALGVIAKKLPLAAE